MDKAQAIELQQLLNKVGGLLTTDGAIGPATVQAIHDAYALAGLPVSDQASDELIAWLRQQPDPSPVLPTEGVVFIAQQEVSSRAYYDKFEASPCWPGGASGITIGVGYDLHFQADFETCWAPQLDAATAAALRPWIGKQGSQEGADTLKPYKIPFFAAWKAFTATTLPAEVKATEGAYGDITTLPPLCRAALVSLVYNRGPSLGPDPSRTEMHTILTLIQAGKLDEVPAQFLSMQRLWPATSGLHQRRAAEAALWQKGLQSADAPAPAMA
ncbi:hypothetical protein [Azospirillum sp. SYSU D00513]|uniref:hypothetical protein n=1 Tax=Azospirillum sp. SYSU D00513 TaxID=2812561 RepID=UPI001A95E5A5|nr:hypothetical protein [Azospirillum sp. SYSU D00513]